MKDCEPGKPFCLSVSFNAPHAEDNDPKQYYWQKEVNDLYRGAKFPVPKTMTEEFFDAQPEFLRKSESRVRFKWLCSGHCSKLNRSRFFCIRASSGKNVFHCRGQRR